MVDLIEFQSYLESLIENLSKKKSLRDCYVSTFAELKIRVTYSSSQDKKKQEESYSVLEGLQKYASKQVLLSGKPGSGKSTALLELQLREADRCLNAISQNSDEIAQIPVLIELRSLKTSVLATIQEKLELHGIDLDRKNTIKLIRDRKLLPLLDGLNELPNSSAFQEVEEFRELCSNFNAPLIISTRELGSTLIQEGKKLEMSPLTEPQMRDFVNRRLPETGEKLLGQLGEKLKELGETPLLLQMLCEVFSEQGEIPKNRGDLFRKEFNRRYKAFKPERLRNVSEDSRRFAFELLCYLAYRMVQGNPHVDPCKPTASWITIFKTQAENVLAEYLSEENNPKGKAKEWLEDLLEWDLLQIASDLENIEFHHQLFQEYYAGEYLAPRLEKLSDEELQQNYLNYLKWTESIAIAVSFIESEALAVRILNLAIHTDFKLSVKLIKSLNERYIAQIVDLLEKDNISVLVRYWLYGQAKIKLQVPELIKIVNTEEKKLSYAAAHALAKIVPELDNSHEIADFLEARGLIKVIKSDKADSNSKTVKDILKTWQEYEQNMNFLEKVYHLSYGARVAELINELWGSCKPQTLVILLNTLLNQLKNPFSLDHISKIIYFLGELRSVSDYKFISTKILSFIEDNDKEIKDLLSIIFRLQEFNLQNKIDVQAALIILVFSIKTKSSEIFCKENISSLYEVTSVSFHSNIINTNHQRVVTDIFDIVSSIQSRCGFYNYEIACSTHISSSSDSIDISERLVKIDQTTKENNQKIKQMAGKPNVQMNFYGSVENAVGNVEGDVNINNAPSSQEEAVESVKSLLVDLRQKYPNASDEEIIDIMTKAFEDMSENNPQKWQRWQNILSLVFTGGGELMKVAIPITAIPIEVTKQLHKIYTENRKQLPNR